MRPFIYNTAASLSAAITAAATRDPASTHGTRNSEYLAGGTTLLDLMKLDVMRPARVVDINSIGAVGNEGGLERIILSPEGLHLGALAKMSAVAGHADVLAGYPVIAESLQLAASAQLRNMATIGGNVLQRTRCTYFRDTAWDQCNKRSPGSGCAAIGGVNRIHAVLGASVDCIATYPGDFAQALLALDAEVSTTGPAGGRRFAFAQLHRPPGSTPDVETTLAPGELITGFRVPAGTWTRRSVYIKVRDRQSYEFALASAAVALDMDNGIVRQARIALGGVATVPWRARGAEAALSSEAVTEATATEAARFAFADATAYSHNAFKIALGQSTLVRALLQAAKLEA